MLSGGKVPEDTLSIGGKASAGGCRGEYRQEQGVASLGEHPATPTSCLAHEHLLRQPADLDTLTHKAPG